MYRFINYIRNRFYKFPQKKITIIEYYGLFPFTTEGKQKSIREKAFEKSWHVRDFEIKLYWERAKYFWAFIASSFVAYYATISSDSITKNNPKLEYLIISIGYIFALAWFLVNIGSKKWQKNWEGHIDRLEKEFTGPLYRTVLSGGNYSVSRVNIFVSLFITFMWMVLGYNYLDNHDYIFSTSFDELDVFISLVSLITFIFSLLLLFISKTGLGASDFKYKVRDFK